MVETTKLVYANATKSLRTTVPRGIAKQFELEAGSMISWKIVPKDGILVIEVRADREQIT